nr:extensin family protein [Alsobacter ponti]
MPPERPPEFGGVQPKPAVEGEKKGPAGAGEATEAALPEGEIACRKRLEDMKVVFRPLPAIVEGDCGAPAPLQVSRLPGDVSVGEGTRLTCDATEALARWARDSVAPQAESLLQKKVTGLLIGVSYECRGRNRDPKAKLSEHAFANGVDLSGFALEGKTTISVGKTAPESAEEKFVATVRKSACDAFTTVLGPGVEAHDDHLHLDMRRRSRGYRLCQ